MPVSSQGIMANHEACRHGATRWRFFAKDRLIMIKSQVTATTMVA